MGAPSAIAGLERHAVIEKLTSTSRRASSGNESGVAQVEVKRVGGGYHVSTVTPSDIVSTTLGTVNVLPAPSSPYTTLDAAIIKQILQVAESKAHDNFTKGLGGKKITLVKLLEAYEKVLPLHGIQPQEDVYYYRILLKLSLDPNPDWWAKVLREFAGQPATAAGISGPVSPPAKVMRHKRCSSGGGGSTKRLTGSRQQHQLGGPGSSSCSSPQARDCADSNPQPAQDYGQYSMPVQSWQSMDLHLAGTTETVKRQHQVLQQPVVVPHISVRAAAPSLVPVPASAGPTAAGQPASSMLCRSYSPRQFCSYSQPQSPLRSRASSPFLSRPSSALGPSNCAIPVLEQAGWAVGMKPANSTVRYSYSAAAAKGNCSTAAAMTWPVTAPAAGYKGSKGSMQQSMSKFPARSGASAAAALAAAAAPAPWCPASAASSHLFGDRPRCESVSPGRAPKSLRSSRPTFKGHKALRRRAASSPDLASIQQQQRFSSSGGYSRSSGYSSWGPAGSRNSSPLPHIAYMDDYHLEDYMRFRQRVAASVIWRQHALAALHARDTQEKAICQWQLAMSFWEVHIARRCFQRWRQRAARLAAHSSSGKRRWLLLCCFRWWLSMTRHYRVERELLQTQLCLRQRQQQQQGCQLPSRSRSGSPVHMSATASAAAAAAAVRRASSPGADHPTRQGPSPIPLPLSYQQQLLEAEAEIQRARGIIIPAHERIARAFSAWRQLAASKAESRHLQALLAWHHIQQLQSQVWQKWRAVYEEREKHHMLLHAVYKRQRLRRVGQVLAAWREWAPIKRAKRRVARDALAVVTSGVRWRVLSAWKAYMLARRQKNRSKGRAAAHCRVVTLKRYLGRWGKVFVLSNAFEEMASQHLDALRVKQLQQMLAWWQRWMYLHQRKTDMMVDVMQHMGNQCKARCLTAWRGAIKRRQELDRLFLKAQAAHQRAAARAALEAWLGHWLRKKRHQQLLLEGIRLELQRRRAAAFFRWREFVGQRRQEQEATEQIMCHDMTLVWRTHWDRWAAVLAARQRWQQERAQLQASQAVRCLRYWRARVKQKADWRRFTEVAMQKLTFWRLHAALQHWRRTAHRNRALRELLGSYLASSAEQQMRVALWKWREYLAARMAKRMKQLSALLHWEHLLLRKGLGHWVQRTDDWRQRRVMALRADSYHTIRVMDLALTAWVSYWVEAQELRQKAAFFRKGREIEQQILMLRAWRERAAILRRKRQRREIAELHYRLQVLDTSFTCWQQEVVLARNVRKRLAAAISHWQLLAASKAFSQWLSWTRTRRARHKKAKGFMELLLGKNLAWAFSMLRANAIRKRGSRLAQGHWQGKLLSRCLRLWRKQVQVTLAFRRLMLSTGERLEWQLLVDAFACWRRRVAVVKCIRTAARTLKFSLEGGRKRTCFQQWHYWVANRQRKHAMLARALHHWRLLSLAEAFAQWEEHMRIVRLARRAAHHFMGRSLHATFYRWHEWASRRCWLREAGSHVAAKHKAAVMQQVLGAWQEVVKAQRDKEVLMLRAYTYSYNMLLAQAFATWREAAAIQARQRSKLTFVLNHWDNRQVSAAFISWRIAVAKGKEKRERLAAVLLRWQSSTLSKTFGRWRDVVQRKHEQWAGLRLVVGTWQANMQWKAFRTWREAVKASRQKKQVLASVRLYWQGALLGKAFRNWVLHARNSFSTRQELQTVLGHWQAQLLIKAFRKWVLYTSESLSTRQKLRAVLGHWQAQLLIKAFLAWQTVARNKRRQQELLATVLLHWQQQLLASAFRTWRTIIQKQQYRKAALEVAVVKWSNGLALGAVNGWRHAALQQQKRRQLLEVAVARWEGHTKAKAFYQWAENARVVALGRKVLAHWSQRLQHKAFKAWQDAVLLQQQKKQAVELAALKWRDNLMWRAFLHWKDMWSSKRKRNEILAAALLRWQQQLMSRAFNSLRQYALQKQMMKAVVQRWREGVVTEVFTAWLQYTQYEVQLKHGMGYVQARLDRLRLAKYFRAWAETAWEGPRLRLAVRFAAANRKHRVLHKWRQYLQHAQLKQQLYSAAIGRWRNILLSSAFAAWRARVAEQQRRQALLRMVLERWRHKHLVSAFSAWKEFLVERRHYRAVLAAVVTRWSCSRMAAAFSAWRTTTQGSRNRKQLARVATLRLMNRSLASGFLAWREWAVNRSYLRQATAHVVLRWKHHTLAAAFSSWRRTACHQAHIKASASRVGYRWRNLELSNCWRVWRAYVLHNRAKATAVVAAARHWRRRRLVRVWKAWRSKVLLRRRHSQVLLRVMGNAQVQLLRKALNTWGTYVDHRRKKYAAQHHHNAVLLSGAWSQWRGTLAAAHAKEDKAQHLALVALRRMQNQAMYLAFTRWRAHVAKMHSLKLFVLQMGQGLLLNSLRAWRTQARKQAGAHMLLRRLLVRNLDGAFREWHAVTQEASHWRRVQEQLQEFFQLDSTGLAEVAVKALSRWHHWTLSCAFTSWRAAAQEGIADRQRTAAAMRMRYKSLGSRVIAGFRIAVGKAHFRQHVAGRGTRIFKRRMLLAWREEAKQQREASHKLAAAVYLWSHMSQRKALATWLAYTRQKKHMRAAAVKADSTAVRTLKRKVLQEWRHAAAYLKPLRRAMELMTNKRSGRSVRQVLSVWRHHCHRMKLMRAAVARLMMRQMTIAFEHWREQAWDKVHRRNLLEVALRRLHQLLAYRAFSRWVEYKEERIALRSKGLRALQRMLHLRLSMALHQWKAAAAARKEERRKLVVALKNWHNSTVRKALVTWGMHMQVIHEHQQAAAELLQRREAMLRRLMLSAWHAEAAKLHHHRVVVSYFQARHLRLEGAAVFHTWRSWAAERGRMRRATVAYWNRLMIRAFHTWLHEVDAAQEARGAALRAQLVKSRALAVWALGVAARQRKRALLAAAVALRGRALLTCGLRSWMSHTYYVHMEHVALHFRVRRLGCVMLQQWHKTARAGAAERDLSLSLTHQLAVQRAAAIFAGWRGLRRARCYWQQKCLAGCLQQWQSWAVEKARKNRAWREARVVLAKNEKGRVFYTWRWYTQVRVVKRVAFQQKQRAVREALAIGDQIARRRKQQLLAACFTAWHVQGAKYAKVAQKLASLMTTNLKTCFHAWRTTTDISRAQWAKAQRMSSTRTSRRCLAAWRAGTAAQVEEAATADEVARHFRFKRTGELVMAAWRQKVECGKAQRWALWKVLGLVARAEDQAILSSILSSWHTRAAARSSLRTALASFIQQRRLACLGDYFTTWRQYTVAMRPGAALQLPPGSPVLSPRSARQDRRLMRRMAVMGGGYEVDPGSDDEEDIFGDLPDTAGTAAAAARSARQQPWLQLTKGYRQRRNTLADRHQYDDIEAASGPWHQFDLHSVADSMQQVQAGQASPWQVPSVRTSPDPEGPPWPDTLNLQQLRTYQHHYHYTLRPNSPPATAGGEHGSRGGMLKSPMGVSGRRSHSLSVPLCDAGADLDDGTRQRDMSSSSQAPAGYYYDAAGDLRKVKAWYDGGSPRETADVGWRGSPGRRPRQAAAAAAGANMAGRRRSSQDSDLRVERGADADGVGDPWDADGQGWDRAAWHLKDGRDRGRAPYQAVGSCQVGRSRTRSASPAVSWRRQLVGNMAAAPGSAKRHQQLDDEERQSQEGVQRLLRERQSSELLVRRLPRSVAAVVSPRLGGSSTPRAGENQLQDSTATPEESLFSVGLWRYVGTPE